ncbi:MAG: methionine--tRNA ligase [Candidatus Marinimicrobia bacterium]|nr:methionine--tRNA ligase [Candidatus Neomarinimicrobiota bacterium]MCF7904021.1 methionine--tRNA ligase [Candidatus Neomarinimicrobiota bacterium]
MSRFYVTTPIYYVNDEPHIGHAYTTILADVVARFHRSLGDNTYFLTGTDEHGQKVQQAAEKRGVDPQQHVDEYVVRFQEKWDALNIQYDQFIRTTQDSHKAVVSYLLQKLWDKGLIYKDTYEGWYSVAEERFLTDKEYEEGEWRDVKQLSETNYWFKMSAYQQDLIDYIHDNPDFIQPDFRKNEVLGFLRQELGDLCISRPKSRLNWGIELPFDTDYVTYVWFDALTNYISAIGYPEREEEFKTWWPVDYHLIGKDILTTHAVYWPTMLMAAELPLPKTIFAHGWWLMGEEKMSKSLGNVVKPLDLANEYGVDALRYFLMREMTPGQDASFTHEAFVLRYNSDLANDLGNLVNRITKLIGRNFDHVLPDPGETKPEDADLIQIVGELQKKVREELDLMRVNYAIQHVFDVMREINRYLEDMAPWKLMKTDRERAGEVLYNAAEALRLSAVHLYPVMPEKIATLLEVMGTSAKARFEEDGWFEWGHNKPGTVLGETKGLFPRIEIKESTEEPASLDIKPEISFDDFMKMDIRVATIIKAEKHPNADKLLKLQVDLGAEQRQVIAGIADHWAPEDLVGKSVSIIVNLKPAKIRGEISQGMILAAEDDNTVSPLIPLKDVEAGAKVR